MSDQAHIYLAERLTKLEAEREELRAKIKEFARQRHNMNYLGLYPSQLARHEGLMSMNTCNWPDGLAEAVNGSMCGDEVSTRVADWVRKDQP